MEIEILTLVWPSGLPAPGLAPPRFDSFPTFFVGGMNEFSHTYFRKQRQMSNNLTTDKKIMAISMLCKGSSIRGIERMTGIHRDTIMRLGHGSRD